MEHRCLHCYDFLSESEVDYHVSCIKTFFNQSEAPVLHFDFSEMEKLAEQVALQSISVPGVQPKLSLGWIKNDIEDGHKFRLTIMNALDGLYIMKPPNSKYPEMPENEHLSMCLAKLFKIEIVPVSLIRLRSGELCYITKRIDRKIKGGKIHMIDFLQITELENKYKGTMEGLGKKIGDLSQNEMHDKLRFFELTVFNYLIGNNDMHLKNFSMYLSDLGWVLSPAYDMLNVKLILPQDPEDTALMLGGKKMNFNKKYFDRFAAVLKLNRIQMQAVYARVGKWFPQAVELIGKSFLSDEYKIQYLNLLKERVVIFNP